MKALNLTFKILEGQSYDIVMEVPGSLSIKVYFGSNENVWYSVKKLSNVWNCDKDILAECDGIEYNGIAKSGNIPSPAVIYWFEIR